MELENKKKQKRHLHENKEKNVDEFQEYVLQQKPANIKVKTKSGMKA